MNVSAHHADRPDTEAGTSLFARIFRASLLVGAIGLLGVALLLALNWRQGRTTLQMANEQAPTALAASELMLGLKSSQSNLSAWVTLGEARYRQAWQEDWHERIMPALEALRTSGTSVEFRARIDPLLGLLNALEEAQWWVQEYAASTGNDRGEALLLQEILPTLDALQQILEALATLSVRHSDTPVLFGQIQILRLQSDLRLYESWLHELALHHEPYLMERILQLSAQIDDAFKGMGENPGASMRGELTAAAHRDWQAVSALTLRLLRQIELPDSNSARVVMRTRAVPLTDEVTTQAAALVDRVRANFTTEADRLAESARDATLSAMAILVLLSAAATGVSWWLSRRLSAPVTALSGAVARFSGGKQHEDLEIPDTREFAALTRSFNKMRSNIENLLIDLSNTNKELEQFAYTVSHDLRAPLRAIDGFSQALVEDYGDQLQGEAREYLDLLSQGARDMGRLIDDILWLSRSTRGEMNLEKVNLSELAEEIFANLQRAEPDRKVERLVQPGILVKGDQRLLKNMLDNLLGNAWKFTAQSGPARIRMTSKDVGEVVRIELEDNGAGFDMAYADKLFKPFHRLHNQSEFAGTGIGLSSALRIINRHRGRIEGWGEPGAGARFTIELEKWRAADS